MSKRIGRPINPKSENSREVWKKYGMSRATFYWKKREVMGALNRSVQRTGQCIDDSNRMLPALLMKSPRRWWVLFAAEHGVDL